LIYLQAFVEGSTWTRIRDRVKNVLGNAAKEVAPKVALAAIGG
jgi:hypothetical protein